MREIKFRAWIQWDDKPSSLDRMHTDFEIHADGTITECGNDIKEFSHKFIPMQYTGRKDRNGKEIYDGDIDIDGDVVEFDKHACIFKIGRNWLHSASSTLIQIVGNKYENPELWHGSK